MSLALDFLREYLQRASGNQADFARACGMTPTNVTDILKSDVEISGRNLAKLLRGIQGESDRLDFLAAHLRDQVPTEFADDISVRRVSPAQGGMVAEEGAADEASQLEAELLLAFAALPSTSYRRRIIVLLKQLRKDADLRDLFSRTIAYLDK